MFEEVHRQQAAARAEKVAQLKADMAEVRAFIEAQKQGRRLERRLSVRDDGARQAAPDWLQRRFTKDRSAWLLTKDRSPGEVDGE